MKIDYSKLFTLRSDGRYQGYWHDLIDGKPTGQRHTICDKDPERLFRRIQEKESQKITTFQEVAGNLMHEYVDTLSRGTQKTYGIVVNKLIKEIGNMQITKIEPTHLDQILQKEKNERKSSKYVSGVRNIFKQIMDYAIGMKLITTNPAAVVHTPTGLKKRKIEAPTEKQEKKIRENFDKPFGEFVALLFYTGMRTEEAVALCWSDIDINDGLIYVTKAMDLTGTPRIKETKTEAGERTIPIPPALLQYLDKPNEVDEDDLIFNNEGKPLTRAQISTLWLNWCKAAGLAKQVKRPYIYNGIPKEKILWKAEINPHQLRHYYATVLYENNIDIMTTQKVMGHKDIETTRKIYTSLREKHLKDEYEKLKNIF